MMDQKEYRTQVDAVSFSPDFQDRTVARLTDLLEKGAGNRTKRRNLRTGLIAAAAAAVLMAGAYAAAALLGPGEVASRLGYQAIAAALQSEGAVTVNETRTVGDFEVTLMGLVSGGGLTASKSLDDRERDRLVAVLAMTPSDPALLKDYTELDPPLTVTPLAEGYTLHQVNAWSLNACIDSFVEDGVLYWEIDCDNLEPFADHTVYLAVYPGADLYPAKADIFDISEETGAITVREGKDAALFVLPLDPAKADPQKAQAIVEGLYQPWAHHEGPAPSTSWENE